MSSLGRRLVLWRHGLTEWNETGRFQGQRDIALTDVGLAQAQRAAGLLAALEPSAIVSSDLSRAAATAGTLSQVTGLPVRTDPRLREFYAGAWQGLTGEEIAQRFSETRLLWSQAALDVRAGGTGETRREVAERMQLGIADALADVPAGGLLVVASHGGALRLALASMIDLPLEYHTAFGVLGNCAWSLLSEGAGGWRVEEHNAGTLPQPVLLEEG